MLSKFFHNFKKHFYKTLQTRTISNYTPDTQTANFTKVNIFLPKEIPFSKRKGTKKINMHALTFFYKLAIYFL